MSDFTEKELCRINFIMNEFDFDKVHRCMTAMNWTWRFSPTPPTIFEIKRTAQRLLEDTVKSYLKNGKSGRMGTGGFEVTYCAIYDVLELQFVVTEWDDCYVDEEPEYKNILKKEKRLRTINKLLNGK